MKEHESQPAIEIAPEIVDAFSVTFFLRYDLYPVQLGDGRFVTVQKALGLSQVAHHLQGTTTLGAYALDTQCQAHWLCFDADAEGP